MVLVYGWIQKNRWCLRSACPFPMALRVYLNKNSPIIVCVIAWMMLGSVPASLPFELPSPVFVRAGDPMGRSRVRTAWCSEETDEEKDGRRDEVERRLETIDPSLLRPLRSDIAAALSDWWCTPAERKLLAEGVWRTDVGVEGAACRMTLLLPGEGTARL
jgi:hypothetical protein